MRTRNVELRAEMRRLLREHDESGLSVAEFARRRGLNRSNLYKWRRRLQAEQDEAERGEGRDAFMPVRVTADPPVASIPFEVSLARGLRLQVPIGFDEVELRRLLGVLESC